MGAGPDVSSVLDLVADGVRKHRCILFLGAGVHAPPPEGSTFGCAQLRDDVIAEASHERMRDVQHLLCELVETLDDKRVRYSAEDLERAVVTPPAA